MTATLSSLRGAGHPRRYLSGLLFVVSLVLTAVLTPPAAAQEVLPFSPKPSGSIAGRTLQESVYSPLPATRRLPEDAPNILIVLIDDTGPAQSSTFGGEIATPTMDRLAAAGITYNRFHTTAMCSPTRASLLMGRNHHRVGSGQIAELANDWDGYSGVMPKTSATVAEVLKSYGYHTGAWGKWHNTPANHTTAAGPLDITLKVNGSEVAKGRVPVSAPLGFSANECLDIGTDLGSPVSIDYFDEAPFEFTGTINEVRVEYTE